MHALAHLRCHGRALAQGSPVQLSCLAVADNRLAKAFARAERRAACPPALESAQAQSEAFVAALVASAEPTPAPTASPTPTPVPTPSPTPGCGNGIVDPGEQCDGQSFCGPSCVVPFPTVCCGHVTDKFTWIRDFFAVEGAPLLFDASYAPKPAYFAAGDALADLARAS